MHIGAREYDPVLGQFVSADPVMEHDGSQAIPGYNYADASPVTMSDPDGKRPAGFRGGIIAEIGRTVARVVKAFVHIVKYFQKHHHYPPFTTTARSRPRRTSTTSNRGSH